MSDYPAGRDAVLYAIVQQLARAEKKYDLRDGPTYDRDWLLGAYAVAKQCLEEPKKKPIEFTPEKSATR